MNWKLTRSNRSERRLIGHLFILPVVAMIVFVFLYPIIKSMHLSLLDIRFAEPNAPFVGLRNYIDILHNPSFWHSLMITLLYTAIYTIGVFLVGFFVAVLMKQRFPLRSVWRTIFILPYAIPDAAASLVWLWMLDANFGVINYFLHQHIEWLQTPYLALITVIGITIWRLYPLHALMIFAGMQAIPQDLYDAANIDGANSFQKFFYITIPQLREIINVLLVLTVIWSFRRFTIIWILTREGPKGCTDTLAIEIYQNAFNFSNMGGATAMGNIALVFLVVIVLIYLLVIRRTEEK